MKIIKKLIPFILLQIVLLSVLLILGLETKTILLSCSLIFMISLWTQEDIPTWIPSLIPLVILGPFGYLSFPSILGHYFSSTAYLFLGGMVLAKLIEHQNLHHLFFNKIIVLFKHSKYRLLWGVLLSSVVLSSFISNTAAALLMLPLVVKFNSPSLLLAMGYGVSLGGLATITSSPPNAIFLNFWNKTVSSQLSVPPISFLDWIIMTYPLILFGILIFLLIIGFSLFTEKNFQFISHQEEPTKNDHKKFNFNQKITILIFILYLLGWTFSAFIPSFPSEANWALIMSSLVILFPKKFENEPLLPIMKLKEINFGILLLFGAGLAFADAITSSELIALLKDGTQMIAFLSIEVKLFLITLSMILFTEISSNTAAAAIFIPLIYSIHSQLGLPTNSTLMAVIAAASLSFMLPSATPPNAIIYSAKLIPLSKMLKIGFILNILFAILITYWSLYLI